MRKNFHRIHRLRPVVRHNGHTFIEEKSFPNYRNIRVTFYCKVCSLTATADFLNQNWYNWTGEGAKISCGNIIAQRILEG